MSSGTLQTAQCSRSNQNQRNTATTFVDLVVSSLSSQAGTDFVVRNIEARECSKLEMYLNVSRQPLALLDRE